MWGRSALLLATIVGGLGVGAPAAAAPPPLGSGAPAVAARPDTAPGASTGADASTGAAASTRAAVDSDGTAEVASCRATVLITAQWTGGFYGQVVVANTGTVPIHWRVTLTIPGARITPPPGYIIIQEGASWLIYPPPGSSWNGILPVGASTTFGFTGLVIGQLGQPTATCTATPA